MGPGPEKREAGPRGVCVQNTLSWNGSTTGFRHADNRQTQKRGPSARTTVIGNALLDFLTEGEMLSFLAFVDEHS